MNLPQQEGLTKGSKGASTRYGWPHASYPCNPLIAEPL